MSQIKVQHNPSKEDLDRLGVETWPIWNKEESEFPWSYGEQEICYLLEGEVVVTPDEGESVTFGKGDLVTFSQGLSCTWTIKKAVKKHYSFGD